MAQEGDITVTVPARADYLGVVRSVTASVAARLDLPYEDIEDLRIAVDEACAQLLSDGGSASELSLIITPSGDRIEVILCTDGDVGDWPPTGFEDSLIWQVLKGLTEAPRFERFDGRPGMRFEKRVARATA